MADGLQPGDQLSIFRYATGTDYGIRPQGSYWVYYAASPGSRDPAHLPRRPGDPVRGRPVGDGPDHRCARLIEVGDQVELK